MCTQEYPGSILIVYECWCVCVWEGGGAQVVRFTETTKACYNGLGWTLQQSRVQEGVRFSTGRTVNLGRAECTSRVVFPIVAPT